MTLWIYGDSFSVTYANEQKGIIPEWCWIKLLQNYLKVDLRPKADFGVANEWINIQALNDREKFKENDIVIIQTTQAQRAYFFEDKPQVSNVHNIVDNLKDKGIVNKEQMQTMRLYWKLMQSEEKDQYRNEANYAFLNTLSWMLSKPKVKTVILPGFNHPKLFPIAGPEIRGTMQTISTNEFISRKHGEAWYARKDTPDTRLNHICRDNHKILADRLYDYIVNETPLDMVDGYRNKFLSVETQEPDQLRPWGDKKVTVV